MVSALETLAKEEFNRNILDENRTFNGFRYSRLAREFLGDNPSASVSDVHNHILNEFNNNNEDYKLHFYNPTLVYRHAKEFISSIVHPTSLIHRIRDYFGMKTPFIKAKALKEGLTSFSGPNNQQRSLLDNEDKDNFKYPARIMNKVIAYKNLISYLVSGEGLGSTSYHSYSQKIDKQVNRGYSKFKRIFSRPVKKITQPVN
ncbi:MAG: hypothetical protein PHT54_01655 [Candidatus Nanoarchaeia archaeon]|nr:hypothetical protein [Candidatus Nanoarchaeia archaeon]